MTGAAGWRTAWRSITCTVTRLSVLDIVPTLTTFESVDRGWRRHITTGSS